MMLMMRGCACGEAGCIWEISATSSQFCYRPKIALKKLCPKKLYRFYKYSYGKISNTEVN